MQKQRRGSCMLQWSQLSYTSQPTLHSGIQLTITQFRPTWSFREGWGGSMLGDNKWVMLLMFHPVFPLFFLQPFTHFIHYDQTDYHDSYFSLSGDIMHSFPLGAHVSVTAWVSLWSPFFLLHTVRAWSQCKEEPELLCFHQPYNRSPGVFNRRYF